MSKNTSILLGEHFNDFIQDQIKSGRFNSASEVVRSALRLFEQEEQKKEALLKALKKGETSGFYENVSRDSFLNEMKSKYGK